MTYNCTQGTNVISFSFSTTTNEATFCYQDGLGEGFILEKSQITAQIDSNMIKAIGIVYGHSRYFGVNAFFPRITAGRNIVNAKVNFTDDIGLPLGSQTYECSFEEK